MGKEIKRFEVDNDAMALFNLIDGLNEVLTDYNLSIEVEDGEHDGYDVVILKEI